MNECKGLVSVQCCNFEKDCKFRQDDDCYNPEVMKEALEQKLGMIQPKRKPLPDGTLTMTDEEKKEFKKLVNIAEDEFFERADLVKDHIQIWWRTKHCSWRYDELRSIKAILWLTERFELIKED